MLAGRRRPKYSLCTVACPRMRTISDRYRSINSTFWAEEGFGDK